MKKTIFAFLMALLLPVFAHTAIVSLHETTADLGGAFGNDFKLTMFDNWVNQGLMNTELYGFMNSVQEIAGVSSTELGYLDGVTSSIQEQINAITVGSPVTTAPTYSDDTCTAGQYAFSTTPSMYWCIATDTWDYQVVSGASIVWAGWDNPTPVTYTMTLTLDNNALDGTFTVASTPYTDADSPASITGLNSATEAITYSGTNLGNCTGTAVTGTDDTGPWAVDMSDSAESVSCTETAASTVDVDYYFNFDAATNGQSPQIGSGTITIGSSVNTSTGQVSNSLVSDDSWSAGRIGIPTSGNLGLNIGTIGVWMYYPSLSADATLFNINPDAPYFRFVDEGGSVVWRYMDGSQGIAISAATWTYIEFSWDYLGARQSYRINGGSWVEITGQQWSGRRS